MISINSVCVRFGGFELFKDVSFLINPRDRIGLVGKNGAGKTTLFKLLVGEQSTDEGTISSPSNMTIGYLAQHIDVSDTQSVFEETRLAFEEIIGLEKTINKLSAELSNREDYESESYLKLTQRLSELNERFQILGGGNYHVNIEQALLGLGFERDEFNRPTAELSGGWRMRIELAKILLRRPKLLLLDEPTNHLDIESIQWLEDFLKDYPGAVVLISHDRTFLDNATHRTVELSVGKSFDYNVPYSKYVQLRKERREQQIAAYKNQQKQIEETEQFIERFRYKATKAVAVQSRIKQLDKLDRIEVDEEDLSKIKFKFPEAVQSGQIVVEAKQLSKNYDSLNVLNEIDIIIERGEKVAFVGRNGEGKTTLSKIIMGSLEYSGHLKIGHNTVIGYYAQNQEKLLDENKTVFETIDDEASGEYRTKVRDILGAFLFGGEDIDKKVKVLSGGERSRLALAKMLLTPVNVLLMDEPTNHLDMRSKDVLKEALKSFSGTLILVSHDRDFLDGLVNTVYEFRKKKIKQHLGGIFDFLRKRKMQTLAELNKAKQIKAETGNKNTDKKDFYSQKKEIEKVIRKVSNQVKKSENRISELETEIQRMDDLLANPEKISDHSVFDEYEKLKKDLEQEMENWTELSDSLENENLKREDFINKQKE